MALAALLAAGCSDRGAAPERSAVSAPPAAAQPLPPIRCRRGTTAPAKKAIVDFVARVTKEGGPTSCRRRAHRDVRQRRHALVRAADVRPARVRARPRQDAGPEAPRVEGQAAVQGGARGRPRRPRSAAGERGDRRARHGDPRRHDDRRVRGRSSRTGSRPRSTAVQAAVHRAASTSRCSSCSPTCGRTASRRSSSPAAASSSCGRGPSGSTASRPSRSSAAASRRSTRCATASRCSMRLPEIDFIDDKAGKPVGIQQFIGRRPIAAFGNSDGDFEMLEWTTAGPGAAVRPDRPPHRRRARVGLRPRVARRPARQGARRGAETRLGRRGHEEGLESRVSVREVA